MDNFLCPLCKIKTITAQKNGKSLIFCLNCDIYWGFSAKSIAKTLENPYLARVFTDEKILYPEPLYTKSEKFWYGFSAILVLIAALLV